MPQSGDDYDLSRGLVRCYVANAVQVYQSDENATVYGSAWLVAGHIRGKVGGSSQKLPARRM